MRYSANLVKEIIRELENFPLIRQACARVGIHHSTVYRWMTKHADFHSRVITAQSIGRKNVTDSAESVILHGIQNKEFRSAAFWLTHNEYRYMKPKQGEYFGQLIDNAVRRIERQFESKNELRFDEVFEVYGWIEANYPDDPELISNCVEPLIKQVCRNDPRLTEVFRAAYAEWKQNVQALETESTGTGLHAADDVTGLDSPDHSVIP